MPAERMNMRKIREVLRLKYASGLSNRQIATSCKLGRTSVRRYLEKAAQAGLNWPLPEELDDAALELLLYPSESKLCYVLDFQNIYLELKRKGVTLYLLWEDYKAITPEGLGYTRFCQLYREFKKQLNPVMRQNHKAGEKVFVDYAGLTIGYVNRETGEIFQAQIFVGVLGASNYTFTEATRSQSLPDWIGSHVRMFTFFGGVPEVLVPDNLKSGVSKAHHYDPEINPTYQDLANHYGIAVIPARAGKPRDKAKVEVGVQGVERRILAKLRDQTFFSITEINAAIKQLLEEYNSAPFQKLQGSRLSQFVEIDKPELKPLPKYNYTYAEWKKARSGIDYHIEFAQHYYSVPYKYSKQQLDLRISSKLLECFYKSKLIAVHQRSYQKGYTTIKDHMPKRHQEYAEWTPERLINWAKKTGVQTAALIQAMINSRPHPYQAFRACLGVMRLGKNYGEDRLEKASARALALGAFSYRSLESILQKGLEQLPLPTVEDSAPTPAHDNIRGSNYYN